MSIARGCAPGAARALPGDSAWYFSGSDAEGVGGFPLLIGAPTFCADHLSVESGALALTAGDLLSTVASASVSAGAGATASLASAFAAFLPAGDGNGSISAWVSCADGGAAATAIQWGTPDVANASLSLIVAAQPLSSALPVCDATWHHVAAVHAGGATNYFIDGTAYSTDQSAVLSIPLNAVVQIGGAFAGNITDMRIYNRTLSAAEVLSLATPPLPTLPLAVTPAPAVNATEYAWWCAAGSFGAPVVLLSRSAVAPRPWLPRNFSALVDLCVPCPAGAYCAENSTVPVNCSAGASSAAVGATANVTCVPCGVITFAQLPGEVSCAPCANGTISYVGATTCFSAASLNESAFFSLVSDGLSSLNVSALASGGDATAAGAAVLQTLTLVGSLSALLADVNTTSVTSAIAATALRGALVDFVAASVAFVGNAPLVAAAASSVTALASAPTENAAELAAIAVDTTVPLGDAAATALSSSLAVLTGVSSQLSVTAALSSLSALMTLSALMLPVGVSSGAVDALGGSAKPLGVAPFPPAVAAAMLETVENVLASTTPSVAARNASAAAGVRRALAEFSTDDVSAPVAAALSSIGASTLRAASAGDAASVSSGLGCSAALSMTAGRVDATLASSLVSLAWPLAPCAAEGAAAAPVLPAPAVTLPAGFLTAAAGASALTVDVVLVQASGALVPLTALVDPNLLLRESPIVSHVLAVTLQSRVGAPLSVFGAPVPAVITIPFTSSDAWTAAAATFEAYLAATQPKYSFVCPSVGASAGAPALAFTGAAGAVVANVTVISIGNVSVQCAPPIGAVVVACTPGAPTAFSCPQPAVATACSFYDISTRSWSTSGCSAVRVTDVGVECACTHFTAFAARAAIFASQQDDVGTTLLTMNPIILLMISPHFVALFAAIGGVAGGLAIIACTLDRGGQRLFAEELERDSEMQFLIAGRRATSSAVIIDRYLRRAAGANNYSSLNAPHAEPGSEGLFVFRGAADSYARSVVRCLEEAYEHPSQRLRRALRDLSPHLHEILPLAGAVAAGAVGVTKAAQAPQSQLPPPSPTHPQTRGFFINTLLLRALYRTPPFSILLNFDPMQPRTTRLLIYCAVLSSSFFMSTFLYAWVDNDDAGTGIVPPLSASMTVVFSIIVGALTTATTTVLIAVGSARGDFQHRYPLLAHEIKRRRSAENYYDALSDADLEARVNDIELAAVSAGVIDGLHIRAIRADLGVGDSAGGDDDNWVDAPIPLINYCPCCVRACGQHPDQRAVIKARRCSTETPRAEDYTDPLNDVPRTGSATNANGPRSLSERALDVSRRILTAPPSIVMLRGALRAALVGAAFAAFGPLLSLTGLNSNFLEEGHLERSDAFDSEESDNAVIAIALAFSAGRSASTSASAFGARLPAAKRVRVAAAAAAEHRARAAALRGGSLASLLAACDRVPCTVSGVLSYSACIATIAGCFIYTLAWAKLQGDAAAESFLTAFLGAQLVSAFFDILGETAAVVWAAVVAPAVWPIIAWMPPAQRFANWRNGRAADVLSGSLTLLTIARASARASGLPRHLACLTLCEPAALAKAVAAAAARSRGESKPKLRKRMALVVLHFTLQHLLRVDALRAANALQDAADAAAAAATAANKASVPPAASARVTPFPNEACGSSDVSTDVTTAPGSADTSAHATATDTQESADVDALADAEVRVVASGEVLAAAVSGEAAGSADASAHGSTTDTRENADVDVLADAELCIVTSGEVLAAAESSEPAATPLAQGAGITTVERSEADATVALAAVCTPQRVESVRSVALRSISTSTAIVGGLFDDFRRLLSAERSVLSAHEAARSPTA